LISAFFGKNRSRIVSHPFRAKTQREARVRCAASGTQDPNRLPF
jgi:hypothetical protein